MRRHLAALPLALLLASAAPLGAQSEDALKSFFEGKSVVARIDMPATKEGINVYPERQPSIDFAEYSNRLKAAGTAVRVGQSVMVTTVRLKKDHIEFQLGGGGYGTAGDETSTSVYVPTAAKTQREKNLEKLVKETADGEQKRKLAEELDGLRKERERADALARATAASAEELKRQQLRQKALTAGSRFNLYYRDRVPASALAPAVVMRALAQYAEFPAQTFAGAPTATPVATPVALTSAPNASPNAAPNAPRTLRKGLLRADVDALLGPPRSTSTRAEGRLTVLTATYDSPTGRVTAEFVEGVLIRYTISG